MSTAKEFLELIEKIVKKGGEWCVIAHKSGKNMGCYPSKAGAEKRLKQIAKFREQREPGYIPIDTKGLKDPDDELIDWIKQRLGKHRAQDYSSGVYADLEKLLQKLIARKEK